MHVYSIPLRSPASFGILRWGNASDHAFPHVLLHFNHWRELHDCRSNMRSSLLSGRLSVISDHTMCRHQKWQWYPCSHARPPWPHKWRGPPRCTRAHGWSTWSTPRHAPGWSAAVHGSDSRRAITSANTAGENCRSQAQSIESRTSHGKFISLPGINKPGC